jgi:hypothetical protein
VALFGMGTCRPRAPVVFFLAVGSWGSLPSGLRGGPGQASSMPSIWPHNVLCALPVAEKVGGLAGLWLQINQLRESRAASTTQPLKRAANTAVAIGSA